MAFFFRLEKLGAGLIILMRIGGFCVPQVLSGFERPFLLHIPAAKKGFPQISQTSADHSPLFSICICIPICEDLRDLREKQGHYKSVQMIDLYTYHWEQRNEGIRIKYHSRNSNTIPRSFAALTMTTVGL